MTRTELVNLINTNISDNAFITPEKDREVRLATLDYIDQQDQVNQVNQGNDISQYLKFFPKNRGYINLQFSNFVSEFYRGDSNYYTPNNMIYYCDLPITGINYAYIYKDLIVNNDILMAKIVNQEDDDGFNIYFFKVLCTLKNSMGNTNYKISLSSESFLPPTVNQKLFHNSSVFYNLSFSIINSNSFYLYFSTHGNITDDLAKLHIEAISLD